MNERIRLLREMSINAEPCISTERSELITEFYRSVENKNYSKPYIRGSAFRYIMENKAVKINRGELIVGERGPEPAATPTYPEICLHTMEDFEILNKRDKISFRSDEKTLAVHREKIIPFWKGRTVREKIFESVSPEWIKAYKAGVFTEFQEQRAPGHTVCGDKIYKKGFKKIINDIKKKIKDLDYINDSLAHKKREELKGMLEAAHGIIALSKRYSRELKRLAGQEEDQERKNELELMAKICSKCPENRPETFREALQTYWFVHIGVISELNTWDSFNPGRLDRHLFPFYEKDIKNKTLTKEKAKELLMSFWVKFNNQPAPPKVGVTAQESNTYTDFSLINLGGVDEYGRSAVNELSYLILDVIEEMRILQPSSMVQISKKNPDKFLKRALKVISTGFGQPSIFNTDAIIQEMLIHGKKIEDARNGGASGCVETGAFGKEAYFLSGYFNLCKILELTLNNGFDRRTEVQAGLKTGNSNEFRTFEDFMDAFRKQTEYFADIKIRGNNIIEKIYAEHMPAPFLSLIIDDCIDNAKDYNAGGSRYNTTYIQGVGLGSVTDSLSSIRQNVFDNKLLTLEELNTVLESDFKGYEHILKIFLNKTPKYGNDDEFADSITADVFEIFFNAVDSKPNTRGGVHRINLLPTTVHVYFGSVIGALPDGRKAGTPLSEGISPVQGADQKGPTAVINSASKIDHIRTGGTLLNQKFTPDLLKNEEGIQKILHLVRTYFRNDGHHIQFNVVSADILKKAQQDPQKYRDLIVRVAGYSDYFINLGNDLQNEIIARTEHQEL